MNNIAFDGLFFLDVNEFFLDVEEEFFLNFIIWLLITSLIIWEINFIYLKITSKIHGGIVLEKSYFEASLVAFR